MISRKVEYLTNRDFLNTPFFAQAHNLVKTHFFYQLLHFSPACHLVKVIIKQYTIGLKYLFYWVFFPLKKHNKNMTFSYLSQMPFKGKISRGGIRQNVGRTGAGPDGIPMNTLEQNEKNWLRMMHSRAKAISVDYSSVHPEASSTYLSVTTRDVRLRNIKNMYDM